MAFTGRWERPILKVEKCQKGWLLLGRLLARKRRERQGVRREGMGRLCCSVSVKVDLQSGPPLSLQLLTPSLKGGGWSPPVASLVVVQEGLGQ